jgi:hypothetical protein
VNADVELDVADMLLALQHWFLSERRHDHDKAAALREQLEQAGAEVSYDEATPRSKSTKTFAS